MVTSNYRNMFEHSTFHRIHNSSNCTFSFLIFISSTCKLAVIQLQIRFISMNNFGMKGTMGENPFDPCFTGKARWLSLKVKNRILRGLFSNKHSILKWSP